MGTPNWGTGVKYIRESSPSSNYWWGRNWIGELFPDTDNGGNNVYTNQWSTTGNLLTGTGNGQFIRTLRSNINCYLPTGTTLAAARRRTREEGCTSFFSVENSSYSGATQFHHEYQDGASGTLTTAGQDMAQTYFYPLATSTLISRPFNTNLTAAGGTGEEWSYTGTYDYPRFAAQALQTFYLHADGNLGSALMAHQTADLSKASFMIVNGIDRTAETGSAFIAKYTLLSLVYGFLTAGLYPSGGRVHELPRLSIKTPTSLTLIQDPASISVQWGIQWRRWDGQKYMNTTMTVGSHTYSYGDTWSEADEPDLRYTLCYSSDNGTTWKFMKQTGVILVDADNQVDANSGYLPKSPAVGADAVRADLVSGGDESFNWDVSDTDMFPQGTYLVRVEAFRNSLPMHYAQHMEKIYINRTQQ